MLSCLFLVFLFISTWKFYILVKPNSTQLCIHTCSYSNAHRWRKAVQSHWDLPHVKLMTKKPCGLLMLFFGPFTFPMYQMGSLHLFYPMTAKSTFCPNTLFTHQIEIMIELRYNVIITSALIKNVFSYKQETTLPITPAAPTRCCFHKSRQKKRERPETQRAKDKSIILREFAYFKRCFPEVS